eukprot:m.132045 g.132045  ORF g.132045 m.132045 type:complete len:244 (+) comp17491_c0_seq3:115-846(+)
MAALTPPTVVHLAFHENDVAVLTLDDGKMNAFSFDLIKQFNASLDRIEKLKSKVLVIQGNRKALSAGFDLSIMGKPGGAEVGDLFEDGCRLMMRIFELPIPVVVAATGHALALGAILLLVGDVCVARDDRAKIGLNEVQIGMAAPILAIELARLRLSPQFFLKATISGHVFTPEEALAAGYVHQLAKADSVVNTALFEAARLSKLSGRGFAATKHFAKGAIARHIAKTLPAEVARVRGPTASL